MIASKGIVTQTEFQKHSRVNWRTAHGIWEKIRNYVPSYGYSRAEVDALIANMVSSTAVLADHTLLRGDGGARGIQDSGITIDDTDNITGVGSILATGSIEIDSAAAAILYLDGHTGSDSYVELQENNVRKWTAGYDQSSGRYKISEGIPGTNTRVEVIAGGSMNVYDTAAAHLQIIAQGSGTARLMADSYTNDAYVELQEQNALKWCAGYDHTDGSYRISEGAPGTNDRLKIAAGGAATIPGTLSAAGITDTAVTATNMAAGTIGERPGGTVGDIRYNSTLGEFELYIAAWHNIARSSANVSFGTIGAGQATFADATIADDARGLSSIFTLSADPAKSDGIALYSEGHIGAITTDGSTDGAGIWLNIDSGAILGADVRALDIGIYERDADCRGGNAYGLAIHLDFDVTNPPAAIYPFRLNTNVAGATPDALIFAANKSALGVTEGTYPFDNYLKAVVQDGTVYRIPVVTEGSENSMSFTGATTENKVIFPDNLPDAFSFKEGANFYQTFVTSNGSEKVAFGKNITIPDAGYIGSVSDPDAIQIEADGDVVLTQKLGIGVSPTHQVDIRIDQNAYTTLMVKNWAVHPAAVPRVYISADTAGGFFGAGSSAHATAAYVNRFFMAGDSGADGLSLVATKATGDICIYTGGAPTAARKRARVDALGNLGLGQFTWGANAAKVFAVGTGVAPTSSPADMFQMYSADIGGAAGKAGAHFRDEEGNVVSLGTGGLKMTGNARIKSEIAFPLDGIGKGATAPTLTRDTNSVGYAFAINDDGYMVFELPESWSNGTNVEIILHVYTNDTATDEIRFQAAWSAIPEDGSEAIDGATHTGTLDSGDVELPALAKGLQEVSLGEIAGASLAIGDVVCLKLSRIALVGGTNPSNNPVVIGAEYEWIMDKLGEAL